MPGKGSSSTSLPANQAALIGNSKQQRFCSGQDSNSKKVHVLASSLKEGLFPEKDECTASSSFDDSIHSSGSSSQNWIEGQSTPSSLFHFENQENCESARFDPSITELICMPTTPHQAPPCQGAGDSARMEAGRIPQHDRHPMDEERQKECVLPFYAKETPPHQFSDLEISVPKSPEFGSTTHQEEHMPCHSRLAVDAIPVALLTATSPATTENNIPITENETPPTRSNLEIGEDSEAALNISQSAQISSGQTIGTSGAQPDNDVTRLRWIRINRRFQLIITVVAVIFTFLLLAILVNWIALTTAYVTTFGRSCDVPLKPYYWLVTFQLVLDVFRSDILRFGLGWDPHSSQRMPANVMLYNFAYLAYAVVVLRIGFTSVFLEVGTCNETAHSLFVTSMVYVILTMAAWTTIAMGYMAPFCFVAAMIRYTPRGTTTTTTTTIQQPTDTIFQQTLHGAPPGCVDQMQVVRLRDLPEDAAPDCCICMEDFQSNDIIVRTECDHVFHRQCCREWLTVSRSCPVCRTDIPSSMYLESEDVPVQTRTQRVSSLAFVPTRHQDLVNVLRIMRQRDDHLARRRQPAQRASNSSQPLTEGNSTTFENEVAPLPSPPNLEQENNPV